MVITEQDKTNADAMRSFYDAVFSGNWARIEQLVAKDFVVYEADSMPYRGEFRGVAGLQQVFGQVVSYWNDLKIDVKAITCGEGHVVGVLQFSGEAKTTGTRVSMPIAEITTFENGLITSIKPVYWDTKALRVALGLDAVAVPA